MAIRKTHGKCPHCKQAISALLFDRVTIGNPNAADKWIGVTYLCPNSTCQGVQIDPVALNETLIAALVKRLRKG
jgi:hypothetical protein